MIQNIIFLDIDGVILPEICHLSVDAISLKESILNDEKNKDNHFDNLKSYNQNLQFDKGCIEYLNRLCLKSDGLIVIHSNWRNHFSGQELKDKLVSEGILEKYFHKNFICPKRGFSSQKCHDILYWLDNEKESNKKINFKSVVIDDGDVFNNYSPSEDLIQVTPNEYDGISIDEFRVAAGFFGVLDERLDVYPVGSLEISEIRNYFRNLNDLYYWLYKITDHRKYVQPRATFFSLEANKKFFNKNQNSYYINENTLEEYHLNRKSPYIEYLKEENK